MDIKEVLEIANRSFIENNIDNYFYESRELLGKIINKSKEWIMTNLDYKMNEIEIKSFLELIKRRIDGEPFQYILGEQYFMGHKFIVNSNVLIPRADTEILVYKVLGILKESNNAKILDLCTGSGCIAISLAKGNPNCRILASDISIEAIKLANENSKINNTNVEFIISDLFDNIKENNFDLIISNPPYISYDDMQKLSKDVMNEPRLALYGGEDGLDFYRKISKNAKNHLKDKGYLVFEIGYNQAKEVKQILEDLEYFNIQIVKDYANNDRVIIAQK